MDSTSDIHNLRVAHWSPRSHLPGNAGPGLLVDTCLRQVYIDVSPTAKFYAAQLSGQPTPTERESGPDAYRLLLEIATGLRSAVPGETNVFGQFKEAWAAFRSRRQPAQVARLAPLMHRLINDTKTIRTEYLHGIGGASYGSLVRRLVTPRPKDRILFVGAGNLAQSMLPFFKLFDVGLWNRSAIDRLPESITYFFRPEQGRQAAKWADHVILTTPPDRANDGLWCKWIGPSVRTVVHLGHRSNREPGTRAFAVARKTRIKTYTLDDVFSLRQAQAERRSTQLAGARAACRIRAGQLISDHHQLRFGCLNTA